MGKFQGGGEGGRTEIKQAEELMYGLIYGIPYKGPIDWLWS